MRNTERNLCKYENLLRRLRASPRLWLDDTAHIDRVIRAAKKRVIELRDQLHPPPESPYVRVMWM